MLSINTNGGTWSLTMPVKTHPFDQHKIKTIIALVKSIRMFWTIVYNQPSCGVDKTLPTSAISH